MSNYLRQASLFALILVLLTPTAKMTGLLVPLYIYPGDDWTTLINIKTKYPSLPICAIINPASGAGEDSNSDYVTWITKLKDASIIVVGYDHTSYGDRSLDDVKFDIDNYHTFYPNLDGIFFDEMQYEATGYESYYTTLRAYAAAKNFDVTFGNPGTKLPVSYMSTLDYIVIFEDTSTADLTSYKSYKSYYSQLAMISINQATLPTAWVNSATKLSEWLFVSDDTLPNPYDTLPSYLETLAKLINAANNPKKTTAESQKISKKMIIIISVVCGVGALLLMGCCLTICIFWRRRQRQENRRVKPEVKQLDKTAGLVSIVPSVGEVTSPTKPLRQPSMPQGSLADASPLRDGRNRRDLQQVNSRANVR